MTISFTKWEERLAVAGAVPTRIRYTRKSTESGERQAGSHDQQNDAADREWGQIDRTWVWQDNFTGTTFERPQFQDLLRFCRANPQPRQSPGQIEMYAPSRFGRILDEDKQPDLPAYQQLFAELTKLGWIPKFVTVKVSGDSLTDIIILVLNAHQDASYSIVLSRNVTRGMVARASQGWWTGGSAPWGTFRKDVAADRVLKDSELSSAAGNTILVPNEAELAIWTRAAKRIVGGMSLERVGQVMYNEEGVVGKRGGRMKHGSIRKFLTNPALIGRIHYFAEADATGVRPRHDVQAKWPAMVDVELFEQVARKLSGRRVPGGPRKRRRAELFPLTLICAHCGCEYNGGKLSEAQGGLRSYAHARPKTRHGDDAYERFRAAGCKVWYVDAREIETKVKDLIVAQRASREFEVEVQELLQKEQDFRMSSAASVASAEGNLATKQGAYRRAARTIAAVMGTTNETSDADTVLTEQLTTLRHQVAVAEDRKSVV